VGRFAWYQAILTVVLTIFHLKNAGDFPEEALFF
jgi:hypothetical protein